MIQYDRAFVRQVLASLTPDSRPFAAGTCPVMLVYRLPNCAAATSLDPELVRAVDRLHKAKYPNTLPWKKITAGEVVALIDELEAA